MNIIQLVPPLCATGVMVARMREIRVKRDTVAGKIRANWTLTLFILVGAATYGLALVEYFLKGSEPLWGWLAAGVVVAVYSFWLRAQAIAALGPLLEPARGDSREPRVRKIRPLPVDAAPGLFFDDFGVGFDLPDSPRARYPVDRAPLSSCRPCCCV